MSELLRIEDLHVAIGGKAVIHGLNLQLDAGETLALVGESGCGKSTTALAVAGLLPRTCQTRGQILFHGENLLGLGPQPLRRLQGKEIAMIFQEPLSSLNPVMTVGDQIEETLLTHTTLDRGQRRRRITELIDQVQLPAASRLARRYPHELSGGQRQRIMIAMAIACQPRLLIADEPTTALDVTTQATILTLLDTLRDELNMGLLLITHDLGVVGERAERVAVMHDGRIVEENSTSELFSRPQHDYSRGLLGASLRKDQPVHYRQQRLPEIRVRRREDGGLQYDLHRPATRPNPNRGATAEQTRDTPAHRTPILRVQQLSKTFHQNARRVTAVDNVSFELFQGETLGLAGQSGCGKSTLSRLLLRLLEADHGCIELDGHDLRAARPRQLRQLRARIQMVFQDPYGSLNPRLRIGDMLDQLQKLHLPLNARQRHHEAARILDAVGLPADSLWRYPHEFSGGQRQRIGIARALILKPSVVICDEAVSALDVSVQAQVLNLLVDLRDEFGLSYLFISHDLSVLRYISDRIMVMNEGRILENSRHDVLWRAPQHAYTRMLIDAIPAWQPAAALAA
ncbi:ABC transporter ATP-binding protein [Yanghanlia caeni]|uniref:ABC transporter ATP-binding protein n=1 Tax=Yanghanlia caeni TaxID=3064283 RepID=A0ABU1D7M6_9BURK|nr:ABC transporter ATP-binding protein [Alcaligenaceae bacterium LG-2]HZH56060.1 ABC transporter ATP-binding protein [Burkholderiaceae bacterium]